MTKKPPYTIRYKAIYLFVFFTLYLLNGYAQYRNRPIDIIDQSNGLPNNSVYKVFQDKLGYIWLGTTKGLTRYDGYSFSNYQHVAHQSNSLADNWVQQIEEDSLGNIWVGTHNGGLSKLNTNANTYFNFIQADSMPLALRSTIIWGLYNDSDNNMWIGSESGLEVINATTNEVVDFKGKKQLQSVVKKSSINTFVEHNNFMLLASWGNGLIVFDKTTGETTQFMPSDKPNSLTAKKIKDVVIYNDSTAFLATQGYGLSKLDLNTWEFEQVELGDLTRHFATSIAKDKLGRLWVGTQRDGVIQYDPTKKEHIHFIHKPQVEFSLPDNWIPNVLIDNSQQLWIASGLGVCKTNTQETGFSNFQLNLVRKERLLNEVRVIDKIDNLLWIGTVYGGLLEFDFEKQDFTDKHSNFLNEKLSNTSIWCLANGKENDTWIGTGKGLYRYNRSSRKITGYYNDRTNPNSLPHNNISELMFDNQELWVGTWGNGFSIFNYMTNTFENYSHTDSINKLNNNFISKIYKDSKERIWIGTVGGGVNLFDRESKSFRAYTYLQDSPNSLPSNNIEDISESPDGTLLIATDGGGVCFFNEEDQSFTNYSEKNGLSDNKTQRFIAENDSIFWISTDQGLNRLHTKSGKIEILSRQNGLIIEKFTKGYYRDSLDNFWITTTNGLVYVEPDKVKTIPFDPPVVITKFKRFNKVESLTRFMSTDSTLQLSHNDYVISFDFASLDYRASDKNRYAYILEGLDENWVQLENQHSITFPALPAGKYTLRVRGTNAEGKWSTKELSLPIFVTGPFYKSASFFFIATLVLLFFIYLIIHLRTRQLTNMREKLQELVNSRTKELQTQKIKVETYSHEVEKQRDFANHQNALIAAQNKEMMDSIVYAQRIQKGLFPDFSVIQKRFKGAFVLFKPRDIVSGDFYWYKQQDNFLYLAAVDCTGHGVPGAFMSVLGIGFLNDILKVTKTPDTSLILNELRSELISTLSKGSQEKKIREGMDLALVRINLDTLELQFSGAYNPLYIVRRGPIQVKGCDRFQNNETFSYTLSEFKGQRIPIGQFEKSITNFETKTIQLEKGDRLYLFTDGYIDQMNETLTRKYYAKTFKEHLLEIQNEKINKHHNLLEEAHNTWKGSTRQIDDILVIGLEL